MSRLFLISIDGFRPELIDKGYCEFLNILAKQGVYKNNVKTVIPPITLPCFFSIFYGVSPFKHGVFYNVIPKNYAVRYPNLFEILEFNKIKTLIVFNWRPLEKAMGKIKDYKIIKTIFIDNLTIEGDKKEAEEVLKMEKKLPEFVYIYFGALDEVGHKYGWMTEEYIKTAQIVDKLIEKIFDKFNKSSAFFIHSDHGGYEFGHYVINLKEIMQVPFIFYWNGKNFELNKSDISILDIPPTVLKFFKISIPDSWEGSSFINS